MSDPNKIIMTFAEFLPEAHESDMFEQVAKEIEKEQTQEIVLESGSSRDEELSFLANLVVGGEILIVS